MPSIICQHKSNSAVRAAGVGSTFLISESDREIKCRVSWEVLYVDKLTSYHFDALFAATGGRQQRITTLLLYLWPHDFGSARPDTNCAGKKYELKFTSSKLPETEPVKELKKTVCTSCQQFAGTFDAFLNVKLSTNSSWPKHLGLFVKGISSISLPGFDGHRLFCEESSPFRAKSTFLCPC